MPEIKLKRGLEASIPTLDEAEPGFTTDTEKLFIGSASGNLHIMNESEVNDSIANSIYKIAAVNASAELVDARGAYSVLGDHIRSIESQLISVKNPPNGLAPAKGDGVTDDTTALQAIISYAIQNNKSIYFPGGTYMVSQTLQLNTTPAGCTIIGEGRMLSVLKAKVDITILSNAQGGDSQNIVIRNMGFLGVQNATNTVPVVDLTSRVGWTFSSRFKLENVHIQYGYDGIHYDRAIVSEFQWVTIENTVNDGFVSGGNYVTSTLFSECYVISPGRHGYNTLAEYTTFLNCNCDFAGGNPYNITGGIGVEFISCDCESYTGTGYALSGSLQSATLTNCNMSHPAVANPLININCTQITVSLINFNASYDTASATNAIYITSPNGNQKVVQMGGYIGNGGGQPIINQLTQFMSFGSLNSGGMGIGIANLPQYPLDIFDNGNIKSRMGISGIANWYIKVNSDGSYGLAYNTTDSGAILLQKFAKNRALNVTSSGVQIGGIESYCSNIQYIAQSIQAWTPGTIAANSYVTTTVSITANAAIGDTAIASYNQVLPNGVLLTATITASNVVTVTLFNMTASSASITAGNVKVMTIKS